MKKAQDLYLINMTNKHYFWVTLIIAIFLAEFIYGMQIAYKRGFEAGIEWERNIILEYANPPLDCEDTCETV